MDEAGCGVSTGSRGALAGLSDGQFAVLMLREAFASDETTPAAATLAEAGRRALRALDQGGATVDLARYREMVVSAEQLATLNVADGSWTQAEADEVRDVHHALAARLEQTA